jgi:hypothetical protein
MTPVQEVDQWAVTVPIENGAHFFRLREPFVAGAKPCRGASSSGFRLKD